MPRGGADEIDDLEDILLSDLGIYAEESFDHLSAIEYIERITQAQVEEKSTQDLIDFVVCGSRFLLSTTGISDIERMINRGELVSHEPDARSSTPSVYAKKSLYGTRAAYAYLYEIEESLRRLQGRYDFQSVIEELQEVRRLQRAFVKGEDELMDFALYSRASFEQKSQEELSGADLSKLLSVVAYAHQAYRLCVNSSPEEIKEAVLSGMCGEVLSDNVTEIHRIKEAFRIKTALEVMLAKKDELAAHNPALVQISTDLKNIIGTYYNGIAERMDLFQKECLYLADLVNSSPDPRSKSLAQAFAGLSEKEIAFANYYVYKIFSRGITPPEDSHSSFAIAGIEDISQGRVITFIARSYRGGQIGGGFVVQNNRIVSTFNLRDSYSGEAARALERDPERMHRLLLGVCRDPERMRRLLLGALEQKDPPLSRALPFQTAHDMRAAVHRPFSRNL